MKCILDTSAWYALIDKDDLAHQQALEFVQNNKPELVVIHSVFQEVGALFHHRFKKSASLASLAQLLSSDESELVNITEEDNQNIFDLYTNSPAYLDYVDASVVWLARKYKLPIFGFDKHFARQGILQLPE